MLGSKLYSGFDPRSVGACALWLDAADSTTLSLSGNTVTQWRDKSGLGCNATPYQSPALTTINGVQAIQFGSNRNFDGSANNPTGTVTVFAVGVQPSGSASWDRLVSLATIGTTTDAFTDGFVVALESPSDANSLAGERNTGSIYSAGSVPADTAFQACSMWTPSNVNIWIHGSNRVNSSYTTKTSGFTYSNYAIGRVIQNGNPGSNPSLTWRGSVGEIMVFNSTLSSSQRQTVESYLARKWGLTSSLPSNHPYKTAIPYVRQFSPLDIGGLRVWLDAADESQIVYSTGSNVTQLKDKGELASLSNAYNCTATRKSPGALGKSLPTLLSASGTTSQFDGITGNTGTTYVLLAKNNGADIIYLRGESNAAGGEGYTNKFFVNIATNNTFGYFGVNPGNTLVSGTLSNTVHIFIGTWTGLNATLHDNGRLIGTSSNTTLTQPSATINIAINAGNEFGEFMIFNRALSESERQLIEAYLANKWGLVGFTPSNHIVRLAPALTPQFSPLILGNCSLWLDGLDRGSFTLSGSNVTQWNDKSGNARHATQATGSNQPTYDSNLNTVVFSPTPAKFLQGNANFLEGTNGQWSSFAVAMSTNISQSQHFLEYDVTPNRVAQFLRLESDGRLQSISFGGSTAIAYAAKPTNNVPFLGSARTTGSNTTTFLNGTAGTAANQSSPSTSSNSNFVVGAYSGGSEPLYGRIYEILLYVGGLTLQQHQQVEGYLAWKWGVQSSLPSNHPYRNTKVF